MSTAVEDPSELNITPYTHEDVSNFKLMKGKGYEADSDIDVLELCDTDLRSYGIVMEAGYSEYSEFHLQLRELLTLERNPVKRQLYALQLAVLKPNNLMFDHLWRIVPLKSEPFTSEF